MEHIPSRTAKQLGNSLTKIVNLYARGGFVLNVVLMYQEFEKNVDKVPNLDINTTAARRLSARSALQRNVAVLSCPNNLMQFSQNQW